MLFKVNLFNGLIFSILIVSLLIDRIPSIEGRIQKAFKVIIQLIVCILILLSMIYQLSFIDNEYFITNCTRFINTTNHTDPYLLQSHDNFVYIGLEKSNYIAYYLRVCCCFN